jgi:hypothetical protein
MSTNTEVYMISCGMKGDRNDAADHYSVATKAKEIWHQGMYYTHYGTYYTLYTMQIFIYRRT